MTDFTGKKLCSSMSTYQLFLNKTSKKNIEPAENRLFFKSLYTFRKKKRTHIFRVRGLLSSDSPIILLKRNFS